MFVDPVLLYKEPFHERRRQWALRLVTSCGGEQSFAHDPIAVLNYSRPCTACRHQSSFPDCGRFECRILSQRHCSRNMLALRLRALWLLQAALKLNQKRIFMKSRSVQACHLSSRAQRPEAFGLPREAERLPRAARTSGFEQTRERVR